MVLDGSYRTADWRQKARRIAQQAGVPFLAVEVVTPDQELLRRLGERQSRANVSDGRPDLLEDQKSRFEALTEIPSAERICVAGTDAPNAAAYRVLEEVFRKGLAAAPTER